MTVRFGNYRIFGYVAVLLLSGAVLGLAAHFATVFLPDSHRDFTIYALIVPSLTIFVFLLMLQWAQPCTEALSLFLLGVLWLAMGSWSMDIIGFVQCDTIGGQTISAKNGTQTSYRAYCYEMKIVEAFSWMLFALFAIFFIVLISLVGRAQALGRPDIWFEPIRELPWFGEMPGYYNQGGTPYGDYQPYGGTYPAMYQQPVQMPGSSTIIQPGVNGLPPTVTHVPM